MTLPSNSQKFFVSVYDPSTRETGFVANETRPSGTVEPVLIYVPSDGDTPASFDTTEEAEAFAELCRPLFGAGGAYGPVPVFTVEPQAK